MVAQRDRRAVGGADAAQSAEDEVLLAVERVGPPAHADVLGQSEDVAARRFAQHLFGQWQAPLGARRPGEDVVNGGVVGLDERGKD